MSKRKERSTPPGPDRTTRFRKWTKRLWLLFGLLWVFFFIFIAACAMFITIPSFSELENPDIDYASVVYDRDGKDLGRYFVENRVAIPYDSLNPHLVNALLATEDSRFYRHSGIDFRALVRVGVKTVILQQRSSGGGSTLTQQLAKQLYSARSFRNTNRLSFMAKLLYYKVKEWMTALRLERSYTKEEIIAMYLNEYDFIYGAHGVEAASRTYFGTSQDQLQVEEAAMLIGMLKNAVYYNPLRNEKQAIARRNVVLSQMEKNDVLAASEKDSLQQLPVDVTAFERSSHLTGSATYFRVSLKQWLKNIIQSNDIRKSDGSLYNVDKDGLQIYTTIDATMQRLLEETVAEHMKSLQSTFFSHWKGKDIWSYEEDDISPAFKQSVLDKQIRGTERYKRANEAIFIPAVAEVQDKYEFPFRDYDMDRLLKAEEDPDYIDRLRAQKLVSKKKAEEYKNLLANDNDWSLLKAKWEELQSEVERQFHEKRSMNVFAFTEKGEKDTVMTPLDSLKYHRMILQIGSMAIDPSNGAVRAWVGGHDHTHFKVDHVRSNRQVGSTFKPFLYATAISYQGFSPCFPVTDVQYSIEPGEGNFGLLESWQPKNSDDTYTKEEVSLYEALQKSKNTVSVFLMKQLGDTKPVLGLINNMGIDSAARLSNGRYKVPRQPSIALGTADLNVFEMTAAYATFANKGAYNTPYFVSRVEDRNGKVLYQGIPQSTIALNEDVNYVMIEMLRKAGRMAKIKGQLKSDVGGKTGTTDDHTDGWFMGISPSVVVGTWVGGDDRWVRFRYLSLGQGSYMARPVFRKFMKKLEQHESRIPDFSSSATFSEPEDLDIETDCEEYNKQNQVEEPERKIDWF